MGLSAMVLEKRQWLDLLKCPKCAGEGFVTINLPDSAHFKHCGALICERCEALYTIQEDILSLILPSLCDREREMSFLHHFRYTLPEQAVQKKLNDFDELESGDSETEWVQYEKTFWDKQQYQTTIHKKPAYVWDRYEIRKEHIIKYLTCDLAEKIVLEFGAGGAGTLFHILNPETHRFTYICTDISFNALMQARNRHPSAILVQCDAVNPPFRPGVLDIIFEFGTLHHLPVKDLALKNHIPLLKENGYLGLHDPLNRRKPFFSSLLFLQKLTNGQSEHNEWIEEKRTLTFLAQHGRIVHQHFESSPVRTWLVSLFANRLKMTGRWLHCSIVYLDQFIIKTIGRVWNRMDANALILIWQKQNS